MDFDLSNFVVRLVLLIPGFLLAVTVHEFMHGYIAFRLGDPTAKMSGRLTFNPISHIDPFGALALVVTQMIGWAKPVPVDPRCLANPRRDMIWISLGGPAANLLTAAILAVILHFVVFYMGHPFSQFSQLVVKPITWMLVFALQINVGLAIFNLLPVPPLDGSKILAGLLPLKQAYEFEKLEPYGFIILLLLIISGAVNYVIVPPIRFLVKLLMPGLS